MKHLSPPSSHRRRHLLALPLALPLAVPLAAVLLPAAAGAAAPLLTVSGANKMAFDLAALQALPQRKITTATPWYSGTSEFDGPLLRDVLKAAAMPAASGQTLRCTALNDYRVEIPADDVLRFDVVVAHVLNGKPMSVREKGPLFVIYPFDEQPQLRTTTYFSRCIWQLKSIEVV